MRRKSNFLPLISLLATALLVDDASANCKSKDAKWIKNKNLIITQPNKLDPERIMVSWNGLIKDERCVDEFYVHFWKATERKVPANEKKLAKTAKSVILQVGKGKRYDPFSISLITEGRKSVRPLLHA